MNRGARVAVAVGLAFVTYRVLAAFMDLPSAAFLGVIVGACTYALIGLGGRHDRELAELEAENERLRELLAEEPAES